MATHSNVLAWRIPGMAEPGGLPSMGSHRVGHDWSDLAAAAAAGKDYLKIICIWKISVVNFEEFYRLLIPWSDQIRSVAQSCLTLCYPMNRRTPGLPVHHQSRSSLRLMSIESVMPSSHLILCCRLLLLPPIPPSIRVFSNESTLRMRWPKYWSFSLSIIPSKEILDQGLSRIPW